MKLIGRQVTVGEVIEEVEKDRSFYQKSGEELILSGGEPLVQHEFARSLLLAEDKQHINTAIETTGYATKDIARKVLLLVDHI